MIEEIAAILEELAEILEAEDASLFLKVDNTPDANLKLTAAGRKREIEELLIPAGEGIAGWVVSNEQNIISNDLQNDIRFFGVVDMISGLETESILAVPVIHHIGLIGVLEVINKTDGGEFTEDDFPDAVRTAENILQFIPEEYINNLMDNIP